MGNLNELSTSVPKSFKRSHAELYFSNYYFSLNVGDDEGTTVALT